MEKKFVPVAYVIDILKQPNVRKFLRNRDLMASSLKQYAKYGLLQLKFLRDYFTGELNFEEFILKLPKVHENYWKNIIVENRDEESFINGKQHQYECEYKSLKKKKTVSSIRRSSRLNVALQECPRVYTPTPNLLSIPSGSSTISARSRSPLGSKNRSKSKDRSRSRTRKQTINSSRSKSPARSRSKSPARSKSKNRKHAKSPARSNSKRRKHSKIRITNKSLGRSKHFSDIKRYILLRKKRAVKNLTGGGRKNSPLRKSKSKKGSKNRPKSPSSLGKVRKNTSRRSTSRTRNSTQGGSPRSGSSSNPPPALSSRGSTPTSDPYDYPPRLSPQRSPPGSPGPSWRTPGLLPGGGRPPGFPSSLPSISRSSSRSPSPFRRNINRRVKRPRLNYKTNLGYNRNIVDQLENNESAIFIKNLTRPETQKNLPGNICRGIRRICRYRDEKGMYKNFPDDGSDNDEYIMRIEY
ncbi:hypothetical protein AVEN_122690-1 [Araneus ventricosus]|uniref:Uncharacterized protein n=1 Tax=Araneus ventricosus TaxID=182803 RepID=A0A4Y2P6L0_ARAVE|nr:hypothetical protein AVEN_122690-1 [Araneus ventricosus]